MKTYICRANVAVVVEAEDESEAEALAGMEMDIGDIDWEAVKHEPDNEKQYNPPIAFDLYQPVSGVQRYTVYARNEAEAMEKVKRNDLTGADICWFEELDSETCYVIDADESNTLEEVQNG